MLIRISYRSDLSRIFLHSCSYLQADQFKLTLTSTPHLNQMANEEDNFDIDLYGDNPAEGGNAEEYKDDEVDFTVDQPNHEQIEQQEQPKEEVAETEEMNNNTETQMNSISSTAQPSTPQVQAPKQAPQQQGVKRKDSSSDHRPLDPGATSALLVSDLQWWHTEDDLRGWANQAECEDELKDVTFSEHKVNGKSKGYGVVAFPPLSLIS